jgi:general secretion pathway protein G
VKTLLASLISLFLAAIAQGNEARCIQAEVDMAVLRTALGSFQIDAGRYPTTAEGLSALVSRMPDKDWHGPYIDSSWYLRDPWGHPFIYCCPGTHLTNAYDLYSCGRDSITKSGGDDSDDINNWDASRHWDRYYTAGAFELWIRPRWPLLCGGAFLLLLCLGVWFKRRQASGEV